MKNVLGIGTNSKIKFREIAKLGKNSDCRKNVFKKKCQKIAQEKFRIFENAEKKFEMLENYKEKIQNVEIKVKKIWNVGKLLRKISKYRNSVKKSKFREISGKKFRISKNGKKKSEFC